MIMYSTCTWYVDVLLTFNLLMQREHIYRYTVVRVVFTQYFDV